MNVRKNEGAGGRVLIRGARPVDAQAIIQVHFAAVHETASSFYPSAILAVWSREPDETRYQRIRETILGGEVVVIVAEDQDGIAGFGCIVPKQNELRAVYVHPRASRKGIGTQIVRKLERAAMTRKVPFLQLDASLNAESFYRRCGYAALSRGTRRFASGEEMECVKMRKLIALPPNTALLPPRAEHL